MRVATSKLGGQCVLESMDGSLAVLERADTYSPVLGTDSFPDGFPSPISNGNRVNTVLASPRDRFVEKRASSTDILNFTCDPYRKGIYNQYGKIHCDI